MGKLPAEGEPRIPSKDYMTKVDFCAKTHNQKCWLKDIEKLYIWMTPYTILLAKVVQRPVRRVRYNSISREEEKKAKHIWYSSTNLTGLSAHGHRVKSGNTATIVRKRDSLAGIYLVVLVYLATVMINGPYHLLYFWLGFGYL
jgi:hypothetical protein